jgi:hypothetical protein
MSSKTWRFIHKWTAIFIGVFILVWTISGIVMVLPGQWFNSKPLVSIPGASYKDATISPEEAGLVVEKISGKDVGITGIRFKAILGRIYYVLDLNNGSVIMLDAANGEVFSITQEVAEELARKSIPTVSRLALIEKLDRHDIYYPFGSLPVYRLKFDGDSGNIYYVSVIDGAVSKSTLSTRLRAVISSFHTFEPIIVLFNKHRTRDVLLVFTSMIAILTAITGYYLAILPILRKRGKN